MINIEVLDRDGYVVPNCMVHSQRKNSGFFFGTKVYWRKVHHIGKTKDCDGNILVIGGTGTGKSASIAIPTLKSWGGTIVAIDIKGELKTYYDTIDSPKRPMKVLNLNRMHGTFPGYDPFYLLHEDGVENLNQNARELAQSIIPLPHNVREPFWIVSAQNILTGAILYYFDIGASFNETISSILTTPIEEIIKEIVNSGNLSAKMYVTQFLSIKDFSDNKMLLSICAEMNNKLMVFATDAQIRKAFTPTDDSIKWADINTNNIIISLAEDKLGQWDGAITLLLTQLIRALERRNEKYCEEGKDLQPILLLLDEFPRLGKMDFFVQALATLRSKGVTICLVIQSIAQLDVIYGKDTRRIIVDNCQYKAILGATDADTQRYLSDLVGSIPVLNPSFSSTHNPYTGEIINFSRQIGMIIEPRIYPHEFSTLKDIILVTPYGVCRVDKAPYYNEQQ